MIQIELYALKSSSVSDVVLNDLTVTEAGVIVFADPTTLINNRNEIFNELQNGTIIGVDVDGATDLSTDKSLTDLAYVCDSAGRLDLSQYINQVRWNLEFSPQLIAIVRGEMLSVSMSALGIDPTSMLQKLSPVISAIQVGMFKEAYQMLENPLVIPLDAFLTQARIDRYVNMLKSCDVIQY